MLNKSRNSLGTFMRLLAIAASTAHLTAPATAIAASEAEVRFLRASSTGSSTVTDFATGGTFQARDDAEFVNVSWVFERPIRITRVEIESCGASFGDSAEFVIGPHHDAESFRLTSEGGRVIHTVELPATKAEKVSVLAVNFGHSRPVCLKEARFFDGKKQIKPVFAEAVPATVSTKGSDKSADWRVDHPGNLFDSRPETAWLTAPSSDTLNVDFDRSVKFDRIRIWNGDQKSRRDFRESARVQKILLKGDDGFAEALTVADVAGGQELALKKPFKGRKLSIKVESVYVGGTNVQAGISELRFVNSSGMFYVTSPSQGSRQREIEDRNLESFAKAGGFTILDRELVSADDEDDWIFRLRADGTFFVKGVGDEARKARVFQGHGTYRVEPLEKGKITLTLKGLKASSSQPLDLDPCHLACVVELSAAAPSGPSTEEVIMDTIEIVKDKAGFIVRNRTKRGDRTLPFGDLRVRLSSLQE